MDMTIAELKKICRDLSLYSTPELNDKIYLHYKGFTKIENLDAYTGLKVIYLEGNGLRHIEGLSSLTELRCLYLQENMITAIDNLSSLVVLDSLNLNQNLLKSITNLGSLTSLNTLLVQSNKLSSLDSVRGILDCPSIGVLDLSKNQIEDEGIVQLLSGMPKLKVLYLKDNPVVGTIANYRKTVISSIPTLTYLDDRPVFPDERRMCDAWKRGGKEEEKAEKARIEIEKQDKSDRNHAAFDKLIEDGKKERREREERKIGIRGDIKEETEEKIHNKDDEEDEDVAEAKSESEDDDEEEVDIIATAASSSSSVPSLEDSSDDVAITPATIALAAIAVSSTSSPIAAAQPHRSLIQQLD